MAFTPPTVEDFRLRYPEFAAVDDDERIQVVLEWAISEVGPTWIEKDRAPAIMALVASTLDDEGALWQTTSSVSGAVTAGPITSETVGPLSVRYQTGAQSGIGGGGGGASQDTAYRALYNMLRRRSFPRVGIV
jgi:hypothetical protein